MAARIKQRLSDAFSTDTIEVVDESEAHRGHAGFQEGGESHFRIALASASVTGSTRVAKHRAIYAALGPDIMDRIHALAITLR